MNKRINRLTGGLVATGAATAAIVAMTATGAQAATTFTPTGGPNANFVGSSVSFKDIEADQTLTCSTFNLSGTIVNSGTSRAYGANAGNLTSLTSSGCSNPTAGATTVTPSGTWGVTVTGDAVSGQWPARLTNVKATVSAVNCTFTVSGVVNGKFNPTTQVFTPNTGASGLTVDGGAGTPTGSMCVTLDILTGDTIQVGGSWKNTPPSGSTNLAISNP